MRNFLIIVVGILILNGILLYSGGFEYIKNKFEPEPQPPHLSPNVSDVFKETLEAEVRDKIGMPIEGYEPQMFLRVFPGLVETDFDGVQASIGRYVVKDGRLVHEMDDTKLIHSAAGAITREGMRTLYINVARRIGVDIDKGGTLTEIMSAITSD